ncbi:Oar protein [Iodidimonas muriae]|uniref:Oar protein n=1 Tax=Iodidimonas muriae TaxID=261467 RepID=A0ABQ2L937_9PROT|nr:TonB-dependent receptor [Iodidimonas muriae]GGO05242.1 Oar protein [Iodidimonas muriae]
MGAAKALLLLTASVPAMMVVQQVEAQQTTSAIQGTVTSPNGDAVSGAQVTITNTRTGRSATGTTAGQGRFSFSGLEVGGPYTVLIESDRYQTEQIEGVFISLSSAANLNIQLSSGDIEEIVITAAASVVTQLALGPSAAFGLDTLENFPSIDRDIRDMIRIDPRVTIDGGNNDSISCLGGNNRFNSFTIDGVRTSDSFGLNASGFPSRNNMPIPFDAVRETAVEFAPFDVEYGSFTGCNINVVTKSGDNEFHGSAFGVFNSGGLTGSKIDGRQAREGGFRDWNWGATLGGPIIKDKLWFFGAYEEVQDGGVIVDTGPSGAGFAQELPFLTEAMADSIANTFETVYNRDTLGVARNLPDESRRILGRLDWQITDDHRASFTYSRLREERQDPDDAFTAFTDFTFLDNFEIEGSETESYSARVFSNWTDNFSTEIRASRIDITDIQGPVGGGEAQDATPIPRIEILNVVNPANGASGSIVSGPGFSRSANDLKVQTDQLKFKANYLWGDHYFTAGYELDQLDVFNLFAQDATGTITFDGLENFQAGIARNISGSGSFTGDINDAAAEFSRSIHTLYVQDEWEALNGLTLQFGLRYDWYASSDRPLRNPKFEEKFGFDNTQAFNGLDILQPRFGFSYDAGETLWGDTQFRGGVGIFSGGDPTVWFANNFQNFGGAIGTVNTRFGTSPSCTDADLQVLDGNGNFTGIPNCLTQDQIAQATGNNGTVNAVDPDFSIPSLARFNVGFSHYTDFDNAAGGFFDDWNFQFDLIYSKRRNAPDFVNLALTPTGELAPDGRPIFSPINPLLPGCNATFNGDLRGGFSNVDLAACASGGDDEDIVLTNVDGKDGSSTTASVILSKLFEHDMFNVPGSVNLTFGYAYTDASEVNPSTSSTASSNFEEVAVSVINQPALGPSQFANKHNITVAASVSEEFFDGLQSTFSMFFSARSGRAFSYVFDADADEVFGDSDDEARHLFYVPTGPNDPRVDLSQLSAEDQQALFDLIATSGLSKFAGEIAPRNQFRDPWIKDMDIRFSQDLPGFFGNDSFEVFVDIENFLNLIDNGSNVSRRFDRGNVGEGVPILGVGLSDDGSQFVFRDFDPGLNNDIDVNSSLWAIQFGVRYQF